MSKKNEANARWAVNNNNYFAIANGLTRTKMEPGIYNIKQIPMGPWFLEKERDQYDFPFKIYGTHDHIISRVVKAWDNTEGNLSVLFNGLKGTGKTVSAQLLSNFFIEKGFPVIVVKGYVDYFDDILAQVDQDAVLLFDEFEKNFPANQKGHNNNGGMVIPIPGDESNSDNPPNIQQKLLSTIDGLSRSKDRRLFLFTTNNKNLDPNMVDRPSRIRYIFEFDKLSEDIVKEVLEDTLKPNCKQYMDSVLGFVDKLNVVSMDAIKVVAQEVNIFEEPPENFKHILNLKEKKPVKYNVFLIDPDTHERIKKLSSTVSTSEYQTALNHFSQGYNNRWVSNAKICLANLVSENKFTAHVKVPWDKTWISKLPKDKTKNFSYGDYLIKQHKPEGFSIQQLLNEDNVDTLNEFLDECQNYCLEYGNSAENIIYHIELEPSYEKEMYHYKFADSAYDI
jgi:uncharacterized protein YqiB (DUF1249 family)